MTSSVVPVAPGQHVHCVSCAGHLQQLQCMSWVAGGCSYCRQIAKQRCCNSAQASSWPSSRACLGVLCCFMQQCWVRPQQWQWLPASVTVSMSSAWRCCCCLQEKKAAEEARKKELAELFASAIKQPKVPAGARHASRHAQQRQAGTAATACAAAEQQQGLAANPAPGAA